MYRITALQVAKAYAAHGLDNNSLKRFNMIASDRHYTIREGTMSIVYGRNNPPPFPDLTADAFSLAHRHAGLCPLPKEKERGLRLALRLL